MNELPLRANIHHYYPHPVTGKVEYDEDGDPKLGFYYEITDLNGFPIGAVMGPYNSSDECEEACFKAYKQGDY